MQFFFGSVYIVCGKDLTAVVPEAYAKFLRVSAVILTHWSLLNSIQT